MPTVKIGLNIAGESVSESVRLAQLAEQYGFDYLWLADSQLRFRDVFMTLAVAATKTSKIKLGQSVTNIVTRDWSVIAGGAATLHEISGGRTALGLGRAYTSANTVGLKSSTLSELRDGTLRIRRLLSGEMVEHSGLKLKLFSGGMKIPIYHGASASGSIKLAGEVADGVFLHVGAHPSLFRHAVEKVNESTRAASRKIEDVDKAGYVVLSVSSEKKKSVDAAKFMVFNLVRMSSSTLGSVPYEVTKIPHETVTRILDAQRNFSALTTDHNLVNRTVQETVSDDIAEKLAVVGDSDECAERLRELSKTGVTQLCINIQPPHERPNQLELLAKHVLPKL